MKFLKSLEVKAHAWMEAHADKKRAQFLLGLVSFFEASIVPLPPSTIMLAMIVLSKRPRWIYLATLTTITSVLGGIFGYIIGLFLFDTLGQWIIETYNLADEIAHIGELFEQNAFWALFVAAFTPIPYKAFTIAGGFFSVSLMTFIIASILGRGIRFFIVAYLAKVFGEHFARSIFKYMTLSTLLAVLIIVVIAVWGSF